MTLYSINKYQLRGGQNGWGTVQIESIRSTRSSIRYILDGYAPRDEQEARIYGMKRGLEFIANRQNTITEENLHHLYQISTGDYLPDEDRLLLNHFYRHGEVFIVGGEEPRPGLPAERLPGAMNHALQKQGCAGSYDTGM